MRKRGRTAPFRFRRKSLLDGRGARLANDLVLRAGPARAAYGADQLSALQERNPAAGTNYAVERDEVVVAALYPGFERLGLPAERCRRARLVLRDRDRRDLRSVHALKGDEIAARIHHGDVELPAAFPGFGHGRIDGRLGAVEDRKSTRLN